MLNIHNMTFKLVYHSMVNSENMIRSTHKNLKCDIELF